MNTWRKLQRIIDTYPTATLIALLVFVFLFRFIVAGLLLEPDRPELALKIDRWGEIARNLVEGYGYVFPYQGEENAQPGPPNIRRGPVPVFYLAAIYGLFGYTIWPVMIANWLCDVGTAYLLYLIAKELFPNRMNVAYASVLLWAVYVPEISLTNQAFSEPIFTLALTGHILSLLKLQKSLSWRMAILSGILLGVSTLARPMTLAFLPVIWLLLLISKGLNKQIFDLGWLKRVVPVSIILTFAFGITLLPWTVRNYLITNEFIPVSKSIGITLMWDNYYLDTEDYVRSLNPENAIRAAVEKDLQLPSGTLLEIPATEADDIYQQFAIDKIKAHPDRYLIVSGLRFLRLWFNVGYGAPPSMQSYMVMAINSVFLVLTLIGFIWFRGNWVQKSLPIVGLILLTVVIHMFIIALIRYIFPVMPYMLMFSAYTLIRLAEVGMSFSILQGASYQRQV